MVNAPRYFNHYVCTHINNNKTKDAVIVLNILNESQKIYTFILTPVHTCQGTVVLDRHPPLEPSCFLILVSLACFLSWLSHRLKFWVKLLVNHFIMAHVPNESVSEPPADRLLKQTKHAPESQPDMAQWYVANKWCGGFENQSAFQISLTEWEMVYDISWCRGLLFSQGIFFFSKSYKAYHFKEPTISG